MKKYIPVVLFLTFLLLVMLLPALVQAQGGPGDPGCDPLDPLCPIDGGVGFLLAAGAGYGLKKIYSSNKKDASAL